MCSDGPLCSDRDSPAVGIGGLAALDADERVVHLLRDLADLAVIQDHGAAVVFHFADGRDDRRRAGAEGLSQRAARMGAPSRGWRMAAMSA